MNTKREGLYRGRLLSEMTHDELVDAVIEQNEAYMDQCNKTLKAELRILERTTEASVTPGFVVCVVVGVICGIAVSLTIASMVVLP